MPNFSFDELKVRGRRAYASIFSASAWRPVDAVTVLKIICLLLLFAPQWGLSWRALDYLAGSPRPFDMSSVIIDSAASALRHSYRSAAAYLGLCLVCYSGIFVVPFIRAAWLRTALVVAVCLGALFELTMFDVSGAFPGQLSLLILWGERAQTETLDFYRSEIVRNAAVVLLLSVPLLMRPAGAGLSRKWALLTLSAAVLCSGMVWRNSQLQSIVPIPMGVVANAAVILAAQNQFSIGVANGDLNRERSLKVPPPARPGIETVVLIMDESVRGDYLSINNDTLATTPFLAADPDVVNFGVAISGANCSMFSRLMLRFGMTEDAVADWRNALHDPTMWEFAKRAGYDTAFINSFDKSQQYWNAYSPAERRSIDKTRHIIETPSYLRDFNLVDVLARTVNEARGRKLFVYVDKFGTHPPYANKFPPDRNRFAPADEQEIDKAIADYKNAISWSVDHFFERLKDRIDLGRTLIVYTSDHGQSLFEGGYKQSHCTSGGTVVDGEGKVPLLALTRAAPFALELRKAAAAEFSRFSHFDVFPTILEAMGYERQWIAGRYRSSMLYGSHAEPRGFYIGKPQSPMRRVGVDDKSAGH